VHVRELTIQDGHVRLDLAKQLDGITPTGGLRHDADVGFEIQGGRESYAGEEVVIHNQDTDGAVID
jgi:hypothetical protein